MIIYEENYINHQLLLPILSPLQLNVDIVLLRDPKTYKIYKLATMSCK